jgi:drug/metabolite transporter (DMT)-like permease
LIPVLLALGASLAWGFGDFCGGVKARVLPALSVLAAAQPVGLALLAAAVAIRGHGPPGAEVLWACLAAVFGTSGLVAFYRGMAAGAISLVAPIAGTAAVVPVVWALARGEHPSGLQELGFVLVLGGVVATSWERTPGRARLTAGAGWAALALVAFGGYYVPMHAASRHDFLWASLVFRSTSTTLVWLVVLALGRRLRGIRPHLPVLAAIGVFDTGGNVLFAAASQEHGLLSVVSVLASLYPVVTVLLARTALRERVQRTQEVGVVVTLAGVALVSAG